MQPKHRKAIVPRSSKSEVKAAHDGRSAAPIRRASQVRKVNQLKDEVYREMLLLEVNRPGSEMGLALALLRAVVQSGSFADQHDFAEWLRTVCPLGLDMLETALGEGPKCIQDPT